jgi:hypothetical protein
MQFDHCISSFLKWLKTKKSAHPQVCAFSVSNPFWELNFQRMSNHAGYTITGKRSGSQAPVVQDFIHLLFTSTFLLSLTFFYAAGG